jgi:hypothetical protein
MKLDGAGCPAPETIGALVDGSLTDRERDEVTTHLASCESCYFVFTEAARFKSQKPVATPFRWKQVAAGLAAAATIAVAVNVFMTSRRGGEDPQLAALVEAVGVARPIEPRLTGGFAYAPVRGTVRSTGNEPLTLSPDARIAIANIEKGGSANADQLRTQAIAALMLLQAELAVTKLEDAARREPNDARILSDLSAAYLARAERTGRIDDNQLALGNATKALEIDRVLPTALFNRALALERLGEVKDALAAWQAYLAVDNQSGWADEARAHLRRLIEKP